VKILSNIKLDTASMVEQLRACLVCGRSGVQIPDRPNLTQRCKRSPPLQHLFK